MKATHTLRACASALAFVFMLAGPAAIAAEDDPWPGIAKDVFAGKEIAESTDIVLDAPYRAEDAGVVPISVRRQKIVCPFCRSTRTRGVIGDSSAIANITITDDEGHTIGMTHEFKSKPKAADWRAAAASIWRYGRSA